MNVFAPAKLNLYLHVTKRLSNGYHALDSLVAFADIGDTITIEPADHFQFSVTGPFSGALQESDLDSGPNSTNLIVKAVRELATLTKQQPNVSITLTKNLPCGGGIGGGSSDAATTLWALSDMWGITKDSSELKNLLLSLGADVPVCFSGNTSRIKGIGDVFEPAPFLPETPIVILYPGKPCSTPNVFQRFSGDLREYIALPASFNTQDELVDFLSRCDNDLQAAAGLLVPEIHNALSQLDAHDNCQLARMSGSGSCCFGIFADEIAAQTAAHEISEENPDWWVQSGWLGRVERY